MPNNVVDKNEDKINVVTTFAPLHSHVLKITGKKANVTNLVPSNVSVHFWKPTPQDIISLESADLVIANGLWLEEFLHDHLESLEKNGVSLLEVGGSIEHNEDKEHKDKHKDEHDGDEQHEDEEHHNEELCQEANGLWIEGKQECESISKEQCTSIGGEFNECASACRHDEKAEICTMQCVLVCELGHEEKGYHEEDHSEDKHDEHEKEDEHRHHDYGWVDPHVWLDPNKAIEHIELITEKLQSIDPSNSDIYEANKNSYIEEIKKLSDDIKNKFSTAQKKPFFVFHNAYGHFLEAYGITEYQAGVLQEFEGDNPSVKELTELLVEAKKKNVRILFTEPQFSPKIVETLQQEWEFEVREINPIGLSDSADWYLDNLRDLAYTIIDAMNSVE